jgi:HEAT repeat protein
LRGSISLLKKGKEEERKIAANFLGRLKDKEAIGPLVEVLDDPNESLREEACYALQWLDAKGKPAEPVLVRLRAKDPSVDVRVAATLVLERPTDEESIATFEAGLLFSQNPYVRERCENQLEEIGKLKLPLPEKIYTEISWEKYLEIRQDENWYSVRRECKQGNILYFEAVEIGHHAGEFPHWYRVKLH